MQRRHDVIVVFLDCMLTAKIGGGEDHIIVLAARWKGGGYNDCNNMNIFIL